MSNAVNIGEAARFLDALGGPGAVFAFQTFDDDKSRARRDLNKVLTGTLKEHLRELIRLNSEGAGVYVTVNETDGRGRLNDNISRIRAVMLDLDGSPLDPVRGFSLAWHMLVESSENRWHAYWKVTDFPVDRDLYRRLQRTLAERFHGDITIVDVARVMRLPGFFHNKRTPYRAKLLEVNDFPLFTLAELERALGARGSSAATTTPPADGSAFQAHAGLGIAPKTPDDGPPPWSRELVEDALKAISADCDYALWRNVAFALAWATEQATGDRPTRDEAFALFDAWSASAPGRYSAKTTQELWRNAHAHGGVTLGTIFHHAKQAGWRPKRDRRTTAGIAADQPKTVDGAANGATAGADADKWKSQDPHIASLNVSYFVSTEQGHTLVFREEHDETLGRDLLMRMHFDDFKKKFMSQHVVVGQTAQGIPVKKPLGDWWLNHPDRRQYDRIVFVPNRLVPDCYNRWRGFAVSPAPGSWKLLEQHIKNVICNNNAACFEYLIRWMADGVQRPERQSGVAVVMRGSQGAGKGTFARAYGDIFGAHFVHITHTRHLTGNFNRHLADAVVVYADEAVWGGYKNEESVLRGLITEDTIMIEGKGVNAYDARNVVHLIMATNSDWAVPLGLGDRRFFVLDVNDSHQGDHRYFNAIRDELCAGGYAALLHDLLALDLTNFRIAEFPRTEAHYEQKMRSMDPWTSWWQQKLEEGRLFSTHPSWDAPAHNGAVYADYLKTCSQLRYGHPYSHNVFAVQFKRLVAGDWPKRVRTRINYRLPADVDTTSGGREGCLQFPDLAVCRKQFEKVVGHRVIWPVIEEEPPLPEPREFEERLRPTGTERM